MKYLVGLFLAIVMSACTQLKDFVNDNPVVVSIAVRQAVSHYIEVGKTAEEKHSRALSVSDVLTKVKTLVDGEQKVTVANLLVFVNASIHWDKLSVSDRMAVQDILVLVDMSLKKYENNVDPNTLIVINGILSAAQSATEFY